MMRRLSLLAFALCVLSTAQPPATEWVLPFAVTEEPVIVSPGGHHRVVKNLRAGRPAGGAGARNLPWWCHA